MSHQTNYRSTGHTDPHLLVPGEQQTPNQTSGNSKLAVVTGAAGGLGVAFARKLAGRGYNLWLVDLRAEAVEQVAKNVSAKFGIKVQSSCVDLTDRQQVESLASQMQQLESLELLVNNAGFGLAEFFVESNPDVHLNMVQLHVMSPMLLTRAALPGMLSRNRGAVINVASLSAWSMSAGNVQYAATKNYLTVFSQSLQQEVMNSGVQIQALCPGFVRTDFHNHDNMGRFDHQQVPEKYWISAEDVVDSSLEGLTKGRVIVIPGGLRYRILGRLMQMPILQPIIQRVTRNRLVNQMEQSNNGPLSAT